MPQSLWTMTISGHIAHWRAILSLLPFVSSVGNPDCWSSGFNYEVCCAALFGPTGNTECWDTVFTYEHCCLLGDTHLMPQGSTITKWIGKESGAIRDRERDREAHKLGKRSECQIQWTWAFSVKWGAPIGQYADSSGVPLRHMGSGWDGHAAGDYQGCIVAGGRFFLTELSFESASRDYKAHFGFCAPRICSLEQVANDLVPDYVMQVADARRFMMTLGNIQIWEWPHFLDTVFVHDSDRTLRQQIDEMQFQVQVGFISIASMVVLATIGDMSHTNGIHPFLGFHPFIQHLVHAFSAKQALKELRSPSRSSPVDFLRGLATLLLVSLHLEMAQNESMDNSVEGGNLFRISLCFRCVIIMTVLSLHLALDENDAPETVTHAALKVLNRCSEKLARKFLRHLPLIILSVWWDRFGARFAFVHQPLNYIDGTLSSLSTVEGRLQWPPLGGECLRSYWTCVWRCYTINWQVRDVNERVLVCFGLLLFQAIGQTGVAHGLLYSLALVYYATRELNPKCHVELEASGWNHFLVKRIEILAFLGLFLAARNIAARLQRSERFRFSQRAGYVLAAASWFWSAWINQNDPATGCLARNVKKISGDAPFVMGLCILLSSDLPNKQSNGMIRRISAVMTLISRLSFCILVVEGPFQTFLLRGISGGGVNPLARVARTDPMWDRLLLGPGLLLGHALLALLLFIMVQRPVEVLLKPLLRAPFVASLLPKLLPLYAAFLGYSFDF